MNAFSLLSAGLACACLPLLGSEASAQTDAGRYRFTVLAGERGITGHVDGQAADARFDHPGGLAADASGNIYVTESDLCTIRKITPAGVVTTLAGSPGQKGSQDGVGADARFNNPAGVVVDRANNIYVADAANHIIRKIDTFGNVTTFAGAAGQRGKVDGPRDAVRLDAPSSIAVDGANNVFVSNAGSWREGIRKIAPDGTASTLRLTLPYEVEAFVDIWVYNLRVDRAGNLYAICSDAWDFIDLVKFTSDGAGHYTGVVLDPPIAWRISPYGLGLDGADNLYVKYDGDLVCKIAPDGSMESLGVDGNSREYAWWWMTVDKSGALIVPCGNPFGPPTGAIEMGVIYPQPPALLRQPRSQTVEPGRTVVFNAAATGTPAPAFQWTKNDIAIPGATDATLILNPASTADGGSYRCLVTNSSGSVSSDAATLSIVNTTNGGRINGFSALAADGTLTAGLTVSGGTTPVLLRAVGPGLRPFVPPDTALESDPRLELHDASGALVQINDNWGGDAALARSFATAGAFPLATDSRDAALVRSFEGALTVNVFRVLDGPHGLALFEAYDASGSTGSRFTNLFARSSVDNNSVLIAGVVINGVTSQTVLVRGIGAGQFDPKLEIFDAANVRIAENDNWSSSIAAIIKQAGASALPTGSWDAALVLSLPPGAYTAVLRCGPGLRGLALIEVYEVR